MQHLIASGFVAALCVMGPLVGAFDAVAKAQSRPIHPNPEIEYKLRTARANSAREELVDSANELRRRTGDLLKRFEERGWVDTDDKTALEEIRKLAQKVRTDLGGGGDAQLEDPPRTAGAILTALDERASTLADEIEASTRFELNARLIAMAGEVVALCDHIMKLGGM